VRRPRAPAVTTMRDIEVIDSELRLLLAIRHLIPTAAVRAARRQPPDCRAPISSTPASFVPHVQ
jgi:hypothetical protein